LENHLRDEDLIQTVFGDIDSYNFSLLFMWMLRAVSLESGKDWRTDRAVMLQGVDAMRRFLETAPEVLIGKLPDRVLTATDIVALRIFKSILDDALREWDEDEALGTAPAPSPPPEAASDRPA